MVLTRAFSSPGCGHWWVGSLSSSREWLGHVLVIWHHGKSTAHCVQFMLGVDDLEGLLQPKWFSAPVIVTLALVCIIWMKNQCGNGLVGYSSSGALLGKPGLPCGLSPCAAPSEAPASLWLGGTSWSLVRMLHGREWLNSLGRGSAFYPGQPKGGLMCYCTSHLWGRSVLPDIYNSGVGRQAAFPVCRSGMGACTIPVCKWDEGAGKPKDAHSTNDFQLMGSWYPWLCGKLCA